MGSSQTCVTVEFCIIDGKVVPVAFNARRNGMYPDYQTGEYPKPTDDGQLEDMVADFLEDFGVDLDEWDEDGDGEGEMSKKELIATVGELLLKAKKKEEEDDEDDEDGEDEDDEEDDDDEEDEDDEDEEDEDPKKGKKTSKQMQPLLEALLSKKHVGFAALASKIGAKSGYGKARAAGIAAAIGRKKFGNKKMAAAAKKGVALKDSQKKK